ncbi:MAG: putative lipid II flippase FtsW [Oscillospiraceae bacterium]
MDRDAKGYGSKSKKASKVKPTIKNKYHIFTKGGSVDATFLVLLFLILSIGLVMLFSASYADAYYWKNNSFHYILRQFVFAVFGTIAMFGASMVDYRIYKKYWKFILIVSILLLIFVFTQRSVNNARRWIFVTQSLSFQPSEIAKFALIVYLAKHTTDFQDKMKKIGVGIIRPCVVLLVFVVLLILEPHLSGTVLMIGITAVMLIIGGANLYQFFGCAMLGSVGVPMLILMLGKWDRMMVRVNYWLNPFSAPRAEGYQVIQSLYAIGSGGLMGVGIGNSRQKYLYLPEPQNDFIFAVVCEEIGFIGATFVLILFALLVWRGFVIAIRCKDRFGMMLASGLIAQVGLQVILNVAVVTNTIPNTGISLPFFSYGGTSLFMLMAQMGVLLSISRETDIEKE